MAELVLPSPPVYSVDASFLDSLPPELKEAFSELWSEKERKEAEQARLEALAYQSSLADTLLGSPNSTWEEVDCSVDPIAASVFDANELRDEADPWWDGEPDVHQFYLDLYGGNSINCDPVPSYIDDKHDIVYEDYSYELVNPGGIPFNGLLVNHRDREHPYQLYYDYMSFLEGIKDETSFIYMGSFWQPDSGYLIAKRNAMTRLGGFCVDIDRREGKDGSYFQGEWVMSTLLSVLGENPALKPNYLMLTGTGIQLWYVFGEQIPLLSAKKSPRRKKYEHVLKSLYKWFDEHLQRNLFKVDVPCASISHAFRAPGSPAKKHYPTRLFVDGGRRRKKVNPLDLSDFLGCDLKEYDLEDWNQEEYARIREERVDRRFEPATEKQLEYLRKLESMGCVESVPEDATKESANQLIRQGENVFVHRKRFHENGGFIETSDGRKIPRRVRDPGFYEYTFRRIVSDTDAGSRYNAMFGLAGVAWNCDVPKSRCERDMRSLLGTDWAKKKGHDGKEFTEKDVKSALRGYNPLGALRPKEELESCLTWRYGPSAKRNGRTRHEHLWGDWVVVGEDGTSTPVVNTARENRRLASGKSRTCSASARRESSLERLTRYLADSPLASKRSACKDLSMSLTTVSKYWQEACERAGVADTRSGNHRPF